MEEFINTGFKDKAGRTIYVGDILQHRLGKFGKSGGTKNYKVIQFGKKFQLVSESATEYKYGGMALTPTLCEYMVVLKSDRPRY